MPEAVHAEARAADAVADAGIDLVDLPVSLAKPVHDLLPPPAGGVDATTKVRDLEWPPLDGFGEESGNALPLGAQSGRHAAVLRGLVVPCGGELAAGCDAGCLNDGPRRAMVVLVRADLIHGNRLEPERERGRVGPQTIVVVLGIHELRISEDGVRVLAQLAPFVPREHFARLGPESEADAKVQPWFGEDAVVVPLVALEVVLPHAKAVELLAVVSSPSLSPFAAKPFGPLLGVVHDVAQEANARHLLRVGIGNIADFGVAFQVGRARVARGAKPLVDRRPLGPRGRKLAGAERGAVDDDVVFPDIVPAAVVVQSADRHVVEDVAVHVRTGSGVVEVDAPCVVGIAELHLARLDRCP